MVTEMSTDEYHALVSEKVFTQQVMAEAKANGWMCYHTHDSRRSQPGYPDISAVHPNRPELGHVYMELKVGKNKPTTDQDTWLLSLEASGDRVFVFRPTDWDEIRSVLRGDQR